MRDDKYPAGKQGRSVLVAIGLSAPPRMRNCFRSRAREGVDMHTEELFNGLV